MDKSEICDVLACSLAGRKAETDTNASEELYAEARAQKVAALVCAGLRDSSPLMSDYAANIYHFNRMYAVQCEMTDLLESHGILPVILKGTACGIAYPDPRLRAYGDIDFRVAPDRFEEAFSILKENGYRVTEEIHSYTRHIDMEKNGVALEFHKYWCSNDSWEAPDNALEFNDRVMNAEPAAAEIQGKRFYMLPVLENGLVILQHINHHLVDGLGLRQIIDFMMFVERSVTDAYWESEFGPAAKRYGLDRLAINIAHMCHMYLGLEERNWYSRADESICRGLLETILKSGNFGSKLGFDTDQQVQSVLSSNSTLGGWLNRCYQSGIVHWKAAEKYRLLRPLAGFYGFGRYVVLGIARRGAVGKLKNEFLSAGKHRKLLRKLRTE